MPADPVRHFLGVGVGADPATLLGAKPPYTRVRVETALRARLARVYAHRDGGTEEAEWVRQSLRKAAAALIEGASYAPPAPPPGVRAAAAAGPPATATAPAAARPRAHVLTEFDRFVLAILVGFGGWNAESRAKLVALSASYGVSAAGLMKVIHGLSEYARAGGPTLGVSEITSGAARLAEPYVPIARTAGVTSRLGAWWMDRLPAERWMSELREPSLGGTIKLSLFFGVVTLFLGALFLRALLPGVSGDAEDPEAAAPVVAGAGPAAPAPRAGTDAPVVTLARFDPRPGFLGNAVPLEAANAAYQATRLPESFEEIARKVSITETPSDAVYRNWTDAIGTAAAGWALVDESTRREVDRAVRAVLHETRHAPEVGDRLLYDLVPPRARLAAPIEVWVGAWQAGTLGSITADAGLPAAVRDRARNHLEVALGPRALDARDFATASSAWLEHAAVSLVEVLELHPDVYDSWEMWISAERELGEGDRFQAALMEAAEHVLATTTDLARPGPSVNVLARLLTVADFEQSEVVKRRIVGVFDEVDRVSAHDLWVLTSLLAQLDTAPWFEAALVVPAEAGLPYRNRIRDRIAGAWPRIDRIDENLLLGREPAIRVDARAALRWQSRLEELRDGEVDERDAERLLERLLAASELNQAAVLMAADRPDAAHAVLDEVETRLARPGGGGRAGGGAARPRGRATGRDGVWAEAFGAARRNAEERLTQLRALRAQAGSDLGPLDAETFVRAVYLGATREVRSLARAIVVESFVGGPNVALEMVDQFPDAPRRDGITHTIERFTGRVLPPERSESWPREARLALVVHVLELLRGGTSRLDVLVEALRDSYARQAGVLAANPSLQIAPGTTHAAATLVTDAFRDRAAVMISRTAVPDTMAGLARRRAIRHRLGEGPIQTLVVEQLTALDYLAYLTVAERPAVRDDALAILAESARRRREASHVLRQALEAELAVASMWRLRMALGEEGPS